MGTQPGLRPPCAWWQSQHRLTGDLTDFLLQHHSLTLCGPTREGDGRGTGVCRRVGPSVSFVSEPNPAGTLAAPASSRLIQLLCTNEGLTSGELTTTQVPRLEQDAQGAPEKPGHRLC